MRRITIAKKDIAFDCTDDDTILRAALRAGIGLSYDCNIGACGNCRFELMAGEVEHIRADPPGLSDTDKERGRYLGCQARAAGDCTIKVPVRSDFEPKIRPMRLSAVFTSFIDITHDIREFQFRLETPHRFLPGQYALVSIPGSPFQRAYSFSNADSDKAWHVRIRRVPGGAMSTLLFDHLRTGDAVNLDGPYGRAFLREDIDRDIVCIAGGSGLAPMLSIASAFSRRQTMQSRKLHFFYGARAPRDVCGQADLELLAGFGSRIQYNAAVSEPSGEDWQGPVGMVGDLVNASLGENLKAHEIYFAGPPLMADAIMRMALRRSVSLSQMHYDRFY